MNKNFSNLSSFEYFGLDFNIKCGNIEKLTLYYKNENNIIFISFN